MKRIYLFLTLILTMSTAYSQQSIWVSTGPVKYAFNTEQVGKMPFDTNGSTLTVQGKEFNVSEIDSIYITSDTVQSNSVNVTYNGTKAQMVVAGNIASMLTPSVNGAIVSVVQDSTMEEEVFYTLSGSSDDGSFYQEGDYKATLILNGLTLTTSNGPAININDGKRIEIQLVDSTTTTLKDGAEGTHTAAFMVDGHSEFKGGGNLVITGNTKHGFKSDEYMELKKSFTGVINIKNAKVDGVSVNQYLEIKSGSIIIDECGGDAIQVDCKADTTKEKNGQFIMSGGRISIAGTVDGEKGIKVEKAVTISDGIIEVIADDNALHSKTNMTITGGKIYAYSVAAHGVNAGDSLSISGGTIIGCAATTVGYGIRGATNLHITGGNIFSIGALVSTPKEHPDAQPVLTYQGKVTKTNYSLTDATGKAVMAFVQSRSYSSSKRYTVLISMPTFNNQETYTLNNGATLDSSADNWHGLYLDSEAVTSSGTAIATGDADTPFGMMQLIQ